MVTKQSGAAGGYPAKAAAAAALADLAGVRPTPNGQRVSNLILAAENLADHFTHFYLFFMPDFARDAYRGRPWFDAAATRFIDPARMSPAANTPAILVAVALPSRPPLTTR